MHPVPAAPAAPQALAAELAGAAGVDIPAVGVAVPRGPAPSSPLRQAAVQLREHGPAAGVRIHLTTPAAAAV